MDTETGSFDELAVGAEQEGCGVARGVLQRAERVFPDGPVAKTPCFPSGCWLSPWLGTKIPHA